MRSRYRSPARTEPLRNQEVTADAYNPVTGEVTIASVTGNVTISDVYGLLTDIDPTRQATYDRMNE